MKNSKPTVASAGPRGGGGGLPWRTPRLTPLGGMDTDGSLITSMWVGAGNPKTHVGNSETRMTETTTPMGMMTVYYHGGPS